MERAAMVVQTIVGGEEILRACKAGLLPKNKIAETCERAGLPLIFHALCHDFFDHPEGYLRSF
jgi:hypothetical protein